MGARWHIVRNILTYVAPTLVPNLGTNVGTYQRNILNLIKDF